jgi:hypothetical protein
MDGPGEVQCLQCLAAAGERHEVVCWVAIQGARVTGCLKVVHSLTPGTCPRQAGRQASRQASRQAGGEGKGRWMLDGGQLAAAS